MSTSLQVVAGTTAAKIAEGAEQQVLVTVPSGASVYVGGSDVTSTNGTLVTNATREFWVHSGGGLYAIATVSTTVNVYRSRA